MMDGSGFNLNRSAYWNINGPNDVNADGRLTAFDALAVINDLNLRGPRSLINEAAGTSASEGPTSGGAFVDVNNDNRVTAFDALQVINRLNMSAGDGDPMVRLTVQIVAAGTNDQIDSINKGGSYEMRILTEDLAVLSYMGNTRPSTFPNGDTFLGVATSFFDVLYDKSKTDVQTNDNQIIFISGSPTTGGTFTLTVNDGGTNRTTAPITFASSRVVTQDNIQVALNTLLKATPTSPDVVEVVHEPLGGNNRWRVRFINRLGSQDVPEMTGNVSGLGTASISITEDISGEQSNDAAYADALILRTRYDQSGNPLNDDGDPLYFDDQRAGNRAAFGINDVGGSSLDAILEQRLQGTAPTEIARIRMDAKEAGVVNFNLDVINVLSGLETAVNGFFEDPVTTDLIITVGDTLTITEPLSADDESVNTTEGATATIDIDVLTGDVNNAPTPNTTKTIQSLNTTNLTGSAAIVTVGGVQMVRYTPPGALSNFNGPTSFTYTVVDQNNNTDTATVTINFAAVNDAPVVGGPTTSTVGEDPVGGLVFSQTNGNQITVNDVDSPTGPLSITITAARGTVTLGATGGLTGLSGNGGTTITASGSLLDLNAAINGLRFQPTANANSSSGGPFSVTVTVNDNGQTPAPALQGSLTNVITVNAVNDAPTVELGGFTVIPDVVEGDPLVLNAANNTLIQIADIDSASVTVTLAVATGNTLNVVPTGGVTIGTNGTNSVTLSGSPANVNAALAAGVTFTAALGAVTPETLQITVNDGTAAPVSSSKLIDIDPATRPRARNDVLTVVEDSLAGTANTVDVLYGVNPDIVNVGATPELLSFQLTSLNGGTITRDDNLTPGNLSDDKLIYVPAPNFFGADSFTYTMNDDSGLGADSTGTVNVTVTAVNDKPVAQNDTLSDVAEDSASRIILASDLIGNDSRGALNEAGQTLTIASVTAVAGGTVSINGAGNVVFTPTSNYNGPASFTYTVTDNGQTNGVNDFQTSDPATVSFTITEVNDVPTAGNITLANIVEDSGTYVIPISTLLASVSPGPANESGQMLTLTAVLAPNGGTAAIVGSNVEFTPAPNFNGASDLRFIINVVDNGTTNGAPVPLNVTTGVFFAITAVNDAPVAVNDSGLQTGEGQTINVAVLANDFDVDVAPFTGSPPVVQLGTTVSITSAPAVVQGTASVVGSQIQFIPAAGFFGPVTIQYQLNDGSGAANNLSNIATVTIDVVERNDPPVANPDPNIIVNEDDQNFFIDVFGNDTDPDTAQAGWSFILLTGPAHGTATFDTATRTVKYVPAADYNGLDSFTYQINDNSTINPQSQLSAPALVSIDVRAVNDAPIGGTDPDSTGGRITVIKNQDKTITVAELLANDSAGPANESGQSLTITAVTAGSTNGTVTLNNGVITYTPDQDFLGDDSFTYTLTDNGTTNGANDPKSVQVTVNLVVRDFIPTDVNGFVFRDINNNGTYQVGIDYPLAGVAVTLSGTSEVSGVITPITIETNHLGYYEFLDVEPGDYHLTQAQPAGLGDGQETLGQAASFFANDDIFLDLPQFGLAGGVSTNNFAEGGIDVSRLVNASGLTSESASSTSPNGMVLATTLVGALDLWAWKLQGWTNATDMHIALDADRTAATLVVNGFSTRIFVQPSDPRNANRNNPDPVARLARFRILGWDANGNYMIRLDGTASDFYGVGHALAAAPVAPLSGGEYTDGVDAAMSEENWA